ncbi:Serine/threonine-protein kinase, partial [Linderina pennispora]
MPALHAKIKRGHVEYPSWLSSECKHLLSRLLVVNPLRRATMGEVIRHPWTCKGYGDLGIPTSFLPERTPLVSPDQIDRAVVREMSQYIGFGFGTEEEIRLGLEAILTEDWYRCWLKDKLSPQIDVVRGQVQEDISRAQATQSAVDVAADQLGNVGVKGLAEGSSHVPLPNALSQSLTSAESASGTTLTNPNDTNAAAARLGSAGAPAVSGPQAAAIQQSQAAPANSTISQRLAAQTSDLQNSDAVKKKTSFWKRSSTFITTNIGRTSSKQYSPDPHVPGGQAGEKSQGAAQFRVLSGRAFGDLRSSASQDNTAGQKEYGKPSSAHAPQMYIDPASGMVAVWRDGKLAPPDTDCASIQHEYHDLLATDPLLSIYFLVKERRDRESRAQAQFNAAVRQAEAHASKPGTEIDAQAVPQLAGPDGPAAVPEKRHYLQQQQSQPLPRRPSDHKHELRSRTSTMTSSESYGVGRDATGSRNPQNAGLDIAASLAEPRGKESGLHRMSADIGRHTAMPSVPEEPVNTEDPTTAAIEALSSHTPPRRGSLALTATNSSANAATAMSARPDTKKKRASLFKRFSTLVKGGRNEQKPFDTPPGSNTRLSTNEDREDVGFVEIAHEAKAKESDKLLAAQTAASTQEVPASVASTVAKPAALAAQPVHKYQALHCIEEDDEDPRETGDHQTNAGTDMATNGTGSKDGSEVAAKDESPDTASSRRQYLTKPLISGEKPASEPSEAWQSTDLAPSCNSSRGRLDLDSPSQVPPPSKPLIPPMHPSIQRAGLGKSAAKEQRAETGDSLDPPTDAKDSGTPADNKPTGAREGSAIDEQSKASRSSNEFDAASSMFTGTDIDDYEVITQSSLADHAAGPDRQGFDGIMAGKAELVEKARREIESMDEQEGVGLLDQTPELSYRITSSNARHSAFDAKKSRVRSSSNAMARVISDIVRDGKSVSSGQRAGTKAKLQRNGKQIKEDGQPLLTQRHSFMNVAQHSSTGAIDSSNTGVKIPTSG